MVEENKKQKGFTLAEVLITLGIIGVVAALTIPNLIKNYQKEQYVTQVKKVYTTIEQAIKLSEVENGSYNTWQYGTVNQNGTEAVNFANTYLIPYMSVAKNCGTATGCWVHPKKFDGTNTSYADSSLYSKFILNDGTTIHVATFTTGVSIHFDINGLKGPNIYGHDILIYSIRPNEQLGIAPYKTFTRAQIIANQGSVGCNKTCVQADACLMLLLIDNWQIKDDYPWP